MNKSVENLLMSSHDVISSISSSSLRVQNSSNGVLGDQELTCVAGNEGGGSSPVPSPTSSPKPSPRQRSKRTSSKAGSKKKDIPRKPTSKSDDQLQESSRLSESTESSKQSALDEKKLSKSSDRSKKKPAWYFALMPTYKSRSEDFKRIFKDVPDDERLVVDYSCALQREILVHGRLYVSQNYVCFYANIFMWETLVCLRWKDVTSITKEKTALVIPNAVLISTEAEKFFLTSFTARDKTYLMLFRVWQNALMGQPMGLAEMWQLVHMSYGDELGLTSDDEDYVPPLTGQSKDKSSKRLSIDLTEMDLSTQENISMTATESTEDHLSTSRPDIAPDPTDFSDTTESDAEKHAINLTKSIQICSSTHEGREMNSIILPIHVDQLFTLLFTNSKFFLDFHTARKTTDLVQSAWTFDEVTQQKMRTISLTVSINQTVGPRSSQVTETQVMLPCSKPGQLYSIDVESLNAGIPYADSFSVLSHYCLKSVSENETCLTIYSKMHYKKSVWAIAKSFIEKNCWAGLDDYFCSLIKALSVECEESNAVTSGCLKRKNKRKRRGPGSVVGLQTSTPDILVPNHPAVAADLPRPLGKKALGIRGETGIVSWVLLVAVLILLLINGLLYYKLWGLEEAASYTIMDLHVLKNTPKTEEDWINLLQQQESLHNVEMRKWQRVLHTATQLLRQTEESLTELQMSIHPTATEKKFSVLKSGFKPLNPHNDQRNNPEL